MKIDAIYLTQQEARQIELERGWYIEYPDEGMFCMTRRFASYKDAIRAAQKECLFKEEEA